MTSIIPPNPDRSSSVAKKTSESEKLTDEEKKFLESLKTKGSITVGGKEFPVTLHLAGKASLISDLIKTAGKDAIELQVLMDKIHTVFLSILKSIKANNKTIEECFKPGHFITKEKITKLSDLNSTIFKFPEGGLKISGKIDDIFKDVFALEVLKEVHREEPQKWQKLTNEEKKARKEKSLKELNILLLKTKRGAYQFFKNVKSLKGMLEQNKFDQELDNYLNEIKRKQSGELNNIEVRRAQRALTDLMNAQRDRNVDFINNNYRSTPNQGRGNCLFESLSMLFSTEGMKESNEYRSSVHQYMTNHRKSFEESILYRFDEDNLVQRGLEELANREGSSYTHLSKRKDELTSAEKDARVTAYLNWISINGNWGGAPELQAAMERESCPIILARCDNSGKIISIQIRGEEQRGTPKVLLLKPNSEHYEAMIEKSRG